MVKIAIYHIKLCFFQKLFLLIEYLDSPLYLWQYDGSGLPVDSLEMFHFWVLIGLWSEKIINKSTLFVSDFAHLRVKMCVKTPGMFSEKKFGPLQFWCFFGPKMFVYWSHKYGYARAWLYQYCIVYENSQDSL